MLLRMRAKKLLELREYDRVVLTGFMGSGKSTVGALLAERLGWDFVDLDNEIERREGRTVPQIFAESGEVAFRQAETAALAGLLARTRMVLALGGGAPEIEANRELLAQAPRTAVVYLTADFATLVARCREQADDPTATARPVMADEAVAERRFGLRQPHYAAVATHTLDTTSGTMQDGVAAVLGLLNEAV